MDPVLLGYVAGGAGNEHTQRLNVSAFERWGVREGDVLRVER